MTFSSKTFSLFNASGLMEEIKPVGDLPMYCKITCYGMGMCEKEAAIISGKDSRGRYKAVYISDYEPGFADIDQYTQPHSKKFGIGHYYDDNLETFDAEIVAEYIVKAEAATIQNAKDNQDLKDKNAAEITALPSMFPFLTPVKTSDNKEMKANLVAYLKHAFPGVKFSITKHSYSCYNIGWKNGPTEKDVQRVSQLFEDHETDVTGDFHDYSPSNFNRVFGGVEYIFENRDLNADREKLEEIAEGLTANMGGYHPKGQFVNTCFYNTSLPIGAVITGIEETGAKCGVLSDLYRLSFTAPEVK